MSGLIHPQPWPIAVDLLGVFALINWTPADAVDDDLYVGTGPDNKTVIAVRNGSLGVRQLHFKIDESTDDATTDPYVRETYRIQDAITGHAVGDVIAPDSGRVQPSTSGAAMLFSVGAGASGIFTVPQAARWSIKNGVRAYARDGEFATVTWNVVADCDFAVMALPIQGRHFDNAAPHIQQQLFKQV